VAELKKLLTRNIDIYNILGHPRKLFTDQFSHGSILSLP